MLNYLTMNDFLKDLSIKMMKSKGTYEVIIVNI
ncbi:MAG: hypothetical protein ACI87N_000552 [Flavobacteriales bacterium]|jgi:hypothetical protein